MNNQHPLKLLDIVSEDKLRATIEREGEKEIMRRWTQTAIELTPPTGNWKRIELNHRAFVGPNDVAFTSEKVIHFLSDLFDMLETDDIRRRLINIEGFEILK